MLIKLTLENVDPLETFKHQNHIIKSGKLETESVVNINGTLLVFKTHARGSHLLYKGTPEY